MLDDYHRAKDAGDPVKAQRFWGLLFTEQWDWIRQKVAYRASGVLFDGYELDEAVSEASLRITRNLGRDFDGTTVEDFRARVDGVARITCSDVQRKAAKRRALGERSLHASSREGDGPAGWVEEAYEAEHDKRAAHEQDHIELEEFFAAGREFLDWALPQLSSRPREVFELLRKGKTPEEVAETLGVSRNVVDQNKKRALKRLNELKEQYS
ncbi:RNA polymerase sigma factor [Paraconexibacter sp.]|uniref:RNA polymerase sigma factor n=1 Tax=Paraconexibacter sp. TaxID=2949640 RepID=UPI00356571E8